MFKHRQNEENDVFLNIGEYVLVETPKTSVNLEMSIIGPL